MLALRGVRSLCLPGQDRVIAGSGLASGSQASAALAAEAVHRALARAGLQRAGQVILLLSREFARQADEALRLAARTAGTLQIAGCTASGVFTEEGWQIDRPAAAALVMDAGRETTRTGLSLSAQGRLAYDWLDETPRHGLVDSDGAAWQMSRLSRDARALCQLPGRLRPLLARGLRPLGQSFAVDANEGHELREIDGMSALEHLRRQLPGVLRERPPLHRLCLLAEAEQPGIPILSINADGSLTLAEPPSPGQPLNWALRQPLEAEREMREQLARLAVDPTWQADFALMFSCIGRGPLFYGDDDRDLLAFREHFPGLPLLGAYGIGQIAHTRTGNRMFHNAVLTLIHENDHVQPHP